MPTQETAALKDRSLVLPVAEVVEIVREWVDLQSRHLPDFAGASLWGGITALPPDAPFPLYRDVDIVVVLTQGAHDDEQQSFYRGLMLEVIEQNLEHHHNAEQPGVCAGVHSWARSRGRGLMKLRHSGRQTQSIAACLATSKANEIRPVLGRQRKLDCKPLGEL